MNKVGEKKEGLTLLSFKEIKVFINQEFAILNIGYDNIMNANFVLLSLINKENKYYESLFSLRNYNL